MENYVEMLFEPINNFWKNFFSFLPNLLVMLFVFFIGFLFAWIVRAVVLRVFKVINFDSWCDRVGLTAIIRKGDVWSKPSEVFGLVIFWFLVILFLMIGLSALQLKTIDNLIAQFFLYIPRAFSAILIIIAGYIFTGFLSRAVLIAAVNSGYHYARILAEAVRLLLLVLILSMAFEQLQIAPGIVIAAAIESTALSRTNVSGIIDTSSMPKFSALTCITLLSMAIAFGVGGIDAAKRIIEGGGEEKKEGKNEKDKDIEHL